MTTENIDTLICFTKEVNVIKAKQTEDGKKYIVGIASSDTADSENQICSKECQLGFVEDCKENDVIVELFHQQDNGHKFFNNIAKVTSASVIEQDGKVLFQIEALVNPNSPLAQYTYNVIENPDPTFGEPLKLGLSIFGGATKLHWENINGKMTKVYDRIVLRRIALTDQPSNKDTFTEVVSKEMKLNEENKTVNPEVIEDVSKDSITIQTDYRDVAQVINELASNQTPNCSNCNDMGCEVCKPAKPQITVLEIKAKVDKIINEMVEQVKALQGANLNALNLLCLSEELVEKYYRELDDLEFKVEYRSDVVESSDVSKSEILSDLIAGKNPVLKELSAKVFESKKEEIQNGTRELNQQHSTSGSSSTSANSEIGRISDIQYATSEIIKDQSENSKVIEPVIEVKEEVSKEAIKKEMQIELEQVSKSIENNFKSMLETLTSSLTDSFKKELETVSKEIEVLKNQPVSRPANQISHMVSKEVNKIEVIRNKARNGEMLTNNEASLLRQEIDKAFGIR